MKRNFKDFLLFFNVKILSFYAPLGAFFSAFPLLAFSVSLVPLPLFYPQPWRIFIGFSVRLKAFWVLLFLYGVSFKVHSRSLSGYFCFRLRAGEGCVQSTCFVLFKGSEAGSVTPSVGVTRTCLGRTD